MTWLSYKTLFKPPSIANVVNSKQFCVIPSQFVPQTFVLISLRNALLPSQLSRVQQPLSVSAPLIRCGKSGNKNGCKQVENGVARFTTRVQTRQIRALQFALTLSSDWMKLPESLTLHGVYVTCRKTSLPWCGKTRNMYRFCCKRQLTLCFLQQLFAN